MRGKGVVELLLGVDLELANSIASTSSEVIEALAFIISRQIDYLGQMPAVIPKPVRTSKDPREMLRFDLENENDTIRHYRDRIEQCEVLGEFAMAEQIRQILVQEQDHQIELATALGEEVPNVGFGPQGRSSGKRH